MTGSREAVDGASVLTAEIRVGLKGDAPMVELPATVMIGARVLANDNGTVDESLEIQDLIVRRGKATIDSPSQVSTVLSKESLLEMTVRSAPIDPDWNADGLVTVEASPLDPDHGDES